MKNKNEKAITLIALVITIIVLLILAGVAINMAIDSNGLFGKANEAAESWNTALENEKSEIQDLLNELGVKAPIKLPEGWEPEKVADIVTETVTIDGVQVTRKAPIPKGFVASQITAGEDGKGAEDTISVGLVIYQGDDPVTGTAGSDAHNTAMTTRNQFVWIPVDDIDYMVMCKKNNNEEGSYVENGETITTKICKLELVKNEETKKEELVCKTHNDSTDLCGRSYKTVHTTADKSSPYTYTASMNFSDRTQTWSSNVEPNIIRNKDTDETTGGLTAFTTQMTNTFVNMATSVAKYGGFYVSRYEAGENGASKKNQVVITADSRNGTNYIGVNKWYGLYNMVQSSTAVDKTAVKTHMIYGSQYDQIINFIGSEAQTAHVDRQPTIYGQKTGYAEDKDIMKNMYDLEGNYSEWTAEPGNYGLYRTLQGCRMAAAN